MSFRYLDFGFEGSTEVLEKPERTGTGIGHRDYLWDRMKNANSGQRFLSMWNLHQLYVRSEVGKRQMSVVGTRILDSLAGK